MLGVWLFVMSHNLPIYVVAIVSNLTAILFFAFCLGD